MNNFNATSTTASSTIAHGLNVGAINQTGSATSTFANGIQLTGGCYLLADGTCAGSGGGTTIGSSVTSGTAGSVLFVDGSGNLGQDNSNFYWDDTNNRLGIGTTTPWANLSIAGTSLGTSPLFTISTSTASATSTAFHITSQGYVGVGTTSPTNQLSISELLYVGGTGTSTIENNLQVNGNLQVGTGTLTLTSAGLQSSSALKLTSGGATFTYPTSLGSANQVLKTDASGNLSWGTAGGASTAELEAIENNLILTAFRMSMLTATTTQQGQDMIIDEHIIYINKDC